MDQPVPVTPDKEVILRSNEDVELLNDCLDFIFDKVFGIDIMQRDNSFAYPRTKLGTVRLPLDDFHRINAADLYITGKGDGLCIIRFEEGRDPDYMKEIEQFNREKKLIFDKGLTKVIERYNSLKNQKI